MYFLQYKTTIPRNISHFPDPTENSFRKRLRLPLSWDIVQGVSDGQRDVHCLIIGCSSIFSYIFRQLSMVSLESTTLADTDIV